MTRARDVSAVQNNLGVAIPPAAAGKNAVINGGFDIWARGTSYNLTTAQTYGCADRWSLSQDTAAAATASQVTTSLPDGFRYAIKLQRNAGATSTGLIRLCQVLETNNSIPFAGKTATFSFYAKAGANYSGASNAFAGYFAYGTGTDQSPSAYNSGSWTGQTTLATPVYTLTTSWQRFTTTITIPSTATQLGFLLDYTPVGTAGADDSVQVTGVQLELGSSATPFSRAGGTIQGELAACQRYYQRSSGNQYAVVGGWGSAVSTTAVRFAYPSKVTMRTAPTSVDYGTLAVTPDATTSAIAVSSVTLATTMEPDTPILICALTGATQFRPYQLYFNATTSYVGVSAEL